MNEFYQKLVEAKGGIVLKTERRDSRNRAGVFGWAGKVTTFILDGRTWEYRTGFVYSKDKGQTPYNNVVTYDVTFDSMPATDFFSQLI